MQCLCKSDVACNNGCLKRDLRMECGSRCPVGQKCQNKRFQKRQYASFEPFFAGIGGWGIRATKPIQK
uniref:AWS domain-containing protein n=1 Tax=Panagrolaimus davidi TaxID=227884 RepID=A0A914PIS0_9BILA